MIKNNSSIAVALAAFIAGSTVAYFLVSLAFSNPPWVPLVSVVTGVLMAFILPIWQTRYFNAPKLSVEISAIKRSVSEYARIAVNDHPEFSFLKSNTGRRMFGSGIHSLILSEDLDNPVTIRDGDAGLKIAELEKLINRSKQQLKDLPQQIEERRKECDSIATFTLATFTKSDCDRLNRPIPDEVDFNSDNKQETIDQLKERYQKILDAAEKRYTTLQTNLPIAERKLETLKSSLIDNRSIFTVSASLVNSGRTNTAIKVPGLMRVSIGEGNYIDIKLTLKDFETKSEISANGTRIIVFESPEISGFPEEDRRLINTYWGQSVSAVLYLEDIHNRAYGSNRIAFAEGLYQKIIYDRLAQYASVQPLHKG